MGWVPIYTFASGSSGGGSNGSASSLPGPPGQPGARWHSGQGPPTLGLGQVGDFYLEVDQGLPAASGFGGSSPTQQPIIIQVTQGFSGGPVAVPSAAPPGVGPVGVGGEAGPQGPQGIQGVQGVQGIQGIPGITGPIGQAGQPGSSGARWWSGPAIPQGGLGVIGDYYLQGNGWVWAKQGGVFGIPPMWMPMFTIQGPMGFRGLQGLPGLPGPPGPAGGVNTRNNTLIVDPFAAAMVFDFTNGLKHLVLMTGNITSMAVKGDNIGDSEMVILEQDGSGSHTLSGWWTGVVWPSATAPTLTSTASRADAYGFFKYGTAKYLGFNMGQVYTY